MNRKGEGEGQRLGGGYEEQDTSGEEYLLTEFLAPRQNSWL